MTVYEDTRPHWVYEFYSADRVIYIGCTVNLRSRLQDHRREQEWWPHVRQVRVTKCDGWSAGRFLERMKIATLRPDFNVRDNPDYEPHIRGGKRPAGFNGQPWPPPKAPTAGETPRSPAVA